MTLLQLVNVVAAMRWSGPTFDRLTRALQNAGHASSSGKEPWLKCRFGDNYYVAFYRGGTMQTSGARSTSEAKTRLDNVHRIVNAILPDFNAGEFEIRNLVLTGHIELRGALDDVARRLARSFTAVYEPEQFPAVHLSLNRNTMLLYGSGSIVVTGIKSSDAADEFVKAVENELAANTLLHRPLVD
jgi:TATA-box binding protein (TBP) (component of TFIID and TFIIIB)